MTKTSNHQLSKKHRRTLRFILKNESTDASSLKNFFKGMRKKAIKNSFGDTSGAPKNVSAKEVSDILEDLNARNYIKLITPKIAKNLHIPYGNGKKISTYILTEKGKFWAKLVEVYRFKILNGKPFIYRMDVHPQSDVPRVVKNLKNTFNYVRSYSKGTYSVLYTHPNYEAMINSTFRNVKKQAQLKSSLKRIRHLINGSMVLTVEEKQSLLLNIQKNHKKFKATHVNQL